jgi:hypothetical protein
MKHFHKAGLVMSMAIVCSTALQAGGSGFLPSYEGLKFAPGEYGGKTILTPGSVAKSAGFTKIMIDQPEIFIAEDSAYKGMKPDDALAIAEALRKAIADNMTVLTVVDEPGPDVLYMRLALSDVHLKKKKRRLVSYTPVGIVAHTAMSVAVSDAMKKVDLVGVNIEGESLNAETGEYLGSLLIKLAPPEEATSDKASWENTLSRFDSMGKQLDCRFRNRKLPEAKREDCKILESYREQ